MRQLVIAFVLVALAWLCAPVLAQGGAVTVSSPTVSPTVSPATAAAPRTLRIVADDNFPPYVFRNSAGDLEGYLLEYWRLWERKTGVRVEFMPMNWAEAQRRLLAGEADVIDMIYRTEARESLYDFSPPYANLPVFIYHHVSIGGIGGVAALKGFQVGVQAGDACIDVLRTKGITDLRPYPNYIDLIEAARELEVKIFCLDESPANFYLYRANAEETFRKGFVLYTGQFHRAVRKGNLDTLQLVEQGMEAISPDEDAELRLKWFGTPLGLSGYGRYVGWGLAALVLLGALQLLWNVLLRRQVATKTAALKSTLADRDDAHRASLAARESLAATLQAIPDLLFEFDADGQYVDVFASQQNVLLLPRKRLVGRNVRDVLPPAAAETILAAVGAALAQGSDYGRTVEFDVRGVVRTFELSVSRKRVSPDMQPTALMLSRDITERRIAEQALREAKASADAASEAKSRFLANMSHEIRTPLNAILGLAQMLEATLLPGEPRDLVMRIRLAGAGLLRSLNDVLDLAKIEAGHLELDRQPFRLAQVLDGVIALMAGVARAKGLVLRADDGGCAQFGLLGDEQRIGQILANLVANAIRFSDDGEVVVAVSVTAREGDHVQLRFEVQDQGIGIAPDQLAGIFLPFRQGEAGRHREGGTGLGLAICRQLVELMGGEIGVDSRLGEGSNFWFVVPFAVVDASRLPQACSPTLKTRGPGPRLPGVRLLVVDDSAMNLDLVERVLKREGAAAVLALNGRQALDLLARQPAGFDIVLMDLQMPVLDGLAAIRAIRADPRLEGLPVIAWSAGAYASDRQGALAAGADDFVAKPIDNELLIEILLRWIGARQEAGGAARLGVAVTAASAAAEMASVPAVAIVAEAAATAALAPVPMVPTADAASAAPAAGEVPDGWPIVAGIDGRHVARLLDGDRDFFVELLKRFVGEYADAGMRVKADLDAGDRAAAAAYVHKLRGTAGYVGALELARASQQLEDALRDEPDAVDTCMIRFMACVDALNAGIAEWSALQQSRHPGPPTRAAESRATDAAGPVAVGSAALEAAGIAAPLAVDIAGPVTADVAALVVDLEPLLAQHLLKARRVVDEIDGLVAGSELADAFAPVAAAARALRFDEAHAALGKFSQRLGTSND